MEIVLIIMFRFEFDDLFYNIHKIKNYFKKNKKINEKN
jgi:hypothetical protein